MSSLQELSGDGNNYDVIEEACNLVKDVSGIICEVGTYMGGGIKLTIETFAKLNQHKDRVFVGIDPYGSIPYFHFGEKTVSVYSNKVKNNFLTKIYELCFDLDVNFIFYNLTDSQFFNRFSDGVPIYSNEEYLMNEYALVIIDGPHEINTVINEFNFFKDRISTGGIIVFDDIEQYDHAKVEQLILSSGFILVSAATYKKSYKKL
jgi:hypothetical protein